MLEKNDLTCGFVKTFLYYHSLESRMKVFRRSIAEKENHNKGNSEKLEQKHHGSINGVCKSLLLWGKLRLSKDAVFLFCSQAYERQFLINNFNDSIGFRLLSKRTQATQRSLSQLLNHTIVKQIDLGGIFKSDDRDYNVIKGKSLPSRKFLKFHR